MKTHQTHFTVPEMPWKKDREEKTEDDVYEMDHPEECCPYCGMLEVVCMCDEEE